MRCAVLLFALIVASCVLLSSTAVLPGMKTSITQAGLDYGKGRFSSFSCSKGDLYCLSPFQPGVGLQYLAQRLAGLVVSLPDVSGTKDSIEYTISNIKVQDIKIPAGDVAIQPGSGLVIST